MCVPTNPRFVVTIEATVSYCIDGHQQYAVMPGHAARFGETVHRYSGESQERQGRLGQVITILQEGGRVSKSGGGSLLIESCDVAVVAIDEAGVHLENTVRDFEDRWLSLAAQPAEVVCDQSVQTFCSGAGPVRGNVKLVGFTSRQSPHVCDCIGLLQDSGEPLHGRSESGLLVTDVPARRSGNEALVNCLAMLIAVQKVPVAGEPEREYSIAVPMTRVFRRLRDQSLFRRGEPPSFISPLLKPRRHSSPVPALDLRADDSIGQLGVGDLSAVATASHI